MIIRGPFLLSGGGARENVRYVSGASDEVLLWSFMSRFLLEWAAIRKIISDYW